MRFRWFIILLVSLASAVTLAVSGTTIYLIRSSTIDDGLILQANNTVLNLAERTERMLASVEQSLITLTHASLLLDRNTFAGLVKSTMVSQPLIRTLYFLDNAGKTFAIWTQDGRDPRSPDFLGIDFSYTPLYRRLKTRSQPVWSDKFVSTLGGNTFVGAGIRIGEHAAIAEIELPMILKTIETAANPGIRVTVTDRLGEILVDNRRPEMAGIVNIRNHPVVDRALAGAEIPETAIVDGTLHYPAAARSWKLGWLFLVAIPAGLNNPLIKDVLYDILLMAGSFLLIALLLSPFWSQAIASQVVALRTLADRIADGDEPPAHKKGIIREFNDLFGYLRAIADRIRERETALRVLNRELEQRVADRTQALEASNQDLKASLDHNTRMRDLLVDTEKLAALGRLVAGVAHEMNTPIGNAVMAISTLREEKRHLEKGMTDGLRKSDLDRFLVQSEQGLDIAERNVDRAAELISSFKHVASDQTSSVRRKFELSEMVRDVLLTLHPMLKRSPHTLKTDIEDGLNLDSYPGVIGQILTNLITNALSHAWDEGQNGTITVSARPSEKEGSIRISVSDDGRGIPKTKRKKIFEPFYTTRMGRGGTGLGLNIAQNGARNVLGGNLDVENGAEAGTVFNLDIPLVAPKL